MNPITFDKLLLKTAFCCMASDGHIDNREISLIKKMCNNSPLFKDFDFQSEINNLVNKINTRGLDEGSPFLVRFKSRIYYSLILVSCSPLWA